MSIKGRGEVFLSYHNLISFLLYLLFNVFLMHAILFLLLWIYHIQCLNPLFLFILYFFLYVIELSNAFLYVLSSFWYHLFSSSIPFHSFSSKWLHHSILFLSSRILIKHTLFIHYEFTYGSLLSQLVPHLLQFHLMLNGTS